MNKNSDYIAYSEFVSPVFDNVVKEAITYYDPPKQESWINWEDCGIVFTCTGLYNVITKIETATFTGDQRANLKRKTFEIVSNNEESISVQATNNICDYDDEWNAWICDDDFGTLVFDSLDPDRLSRSA